MIIALAKEGEFVCQHFGHCEEFALYNTETKEWSYVKNPGHQPGFLPGFLKKLGADVVIAGGMGERAQQLFAQEGIAVVVGVSTPLGEAVEKYLRGELVSSGSVCHEHRHAGECHS